MGTDLPAPAALPPGRRVYAVGDVHGCLGRLQALHGAIARDLAARPVSSPLLVHLGDYVDRGPDSAGVIRHLRRGFKGAPVVNLMGNHERMMLDALWGRDKDALAHWLGNGGAATLRSWGLPAPASSREVDRVIGADERMFIATLRPYQRVGAYVFVHAGVRPGLPMEQQSPHDLLWIREPFLSWAGDLGAVVVHGHTPTEAPVLKTNRIGVDTGAVLGGSLTCVVLEEDRLRFMFA